MSQSVQPSAPKESGIAFYMLMALLGSVFLAIAIYVAYLYMQ